MALPVPLGGTYQALIDVSVYCNRALQKIQEIQGVLLC